jgi:hypothetical protein
MAEKWEFDATGFITKDILMQLITNGFILPQGSLLNGKTKMDADNYYCQAGDLYPISKILNYLK